MEMTVGLPFRPRLFVASRQEQTHGGSTHVSMECFT